MKFYIYKIENLINQKKYIGITTNPETRKRTHFSKLRNDKHCNIRLQNAWNKHGEENFIFEIIFAMDCEKEEAYKCEESFIKSNNSYDNGYNGNLGGLIHNGTKGLFTKNQVFMFLSTYEKYPRSTTVISEIMNVPRKTIGNIVSGTNYKSFYDEFQCFSEEEKEFYFESFCEDTDFMEVINTRKKKVKNKLTSEQVYMILYQTEFGYPKRKKDLLEDFNLCNYSIIQQIVEGKTYKAEVYEYNKMSLEEKAQIKCHYTEMYKSKPFELLETPTK